MNSLCDDVISADVNRALDENKYPWIKPIVQLIESPQNPFLAPDYYSFSSYKNYLDHPTSHFFLSSGYEMEVTFDNADYTNLLSSQFKNTVFSSLTIDRMRTLRTAHRIFITFKINSFESAVPFIEPMLCTAFLYNKVTKNIISDLWNFVPEKCQPFFKGSQFSFDNNNTASFMIDSSIITKKEGIIMILFSHPITADNGMNTVVKYYQNPASMSAVSAAKAVNTSFAINPNAFSTFCWTFANLTTENLISIDFPSPFVIDHSVFEGEISDLISEAQSKHLKQVPFSISFSIESNINQRILRPISSARIMPYLNPIHQLSVHLRQLKMATLSSARNIMIRISLESTESKVPLNVIHSKFNSSKLVEYEYSRVCYHEKSPKFDDFFLINLPYPLDSTFSIVFQIYHVHVKTNDTKSMTEIGKAKLPLFQSSYANKDNIKEKRKSKEKPKPEEAENAEKSDKNDSEKAEKDDKDKWSIKRLGRSEKNKKISSKSVEFDQNQENDELVFIPNEIHTISVSSDKSSKLIVSTYLRSNIISNDKQYNKFIQYSTNEDSNALDPELIKSISSLTLTKNLMIIIDRIIKMYEKMPFFSFDPILALYNQVSAYLKPYRLNHYLLLYAFYFAFRETCKIIINSPNEEQNSQIGLNEKSTASLIDLDQVEFDLKNQHEQANSDTLIDFGNDSLFKNQTATEVKSRRPSLIVQSLYKGSDDVLLHTKMIRGIIIFLKEKETEAVNQLFPLAAFINGLLIKSIIVSKEKSLTDDFIEFTDLYTKYAASSEFINEIAIKYGKFIDLLFDIGLATAASVGNSAFIRNCPLKAILIFVSTAYRPEYFLYSVRFIQNFVDQFCQLVKLSFSGDNCSVMQPFFGAINNLCSIYDDTLKVEVASKLLVCLTDIIPSKIPPVVQISEGVKFIDFVLTYCNENSVQAIIISQKMANLMSLIHYLLNRSTSIPLTTKRAKLRLVYMANSQGVITVPNTSQKSSLLASQSSSNNNSNISINNNYNSSNINDSNNSISNIVLIKACSSLDSSKLPSYSLDNNNANGPAKSKTYFDTVKVKKSRNNTPTITTSQRNIKCKDDSFINSSENATSSSNSVINSINNANTNDNNENGNCFDVELCIKTHAALFRFIGVYFGVSDLNGGGYLFRFAYHALQLLNLPKQHVLKSYYLLHQIILKFSPYIIEIINPCMTKVIHTLFKKALISQHYHKYIALIITALFNRDFHAYKNNNRSFAICTQALSMIHYSQLTLDRFNRFMKLLRDSTSTNNTTNNSSNTDSNSKKLSKKNKSSSSTSNASINGLKEFYDTFQNLRAISIDLENPKLTPAQKATHLIRRFYAFKYSPDAQFNALEDLKEHQIKTNNKLEGMNITILQAALIYEYMVKLNRMPNYYDSKFGGKHRYRLISSTTSFEGFLESKSASLMSSISTSASSASTNNLNSSFYLIGSTNLCPSEIMSDFPIIPSFCDSDVFSESGFVSLLLKCLNEAENIHRSIISNIILDFIWPIYDTQCLYGYMATVFEAYEKMFNQRVNEARSHSRPRIGQMPIERDPFDGTVFVEKKNSSMRNSRSNKVRKSTRSKRYQDSSDNDSNNSFYRDTSFNGDILDNATAGNFEDSDNHNSFFRVLFCGKIFESDNGRAFIYRTEPGTTSDQFKARLNKYYEYLMGRDKVVIVDDLVDDNKEATDLQQNETEKNNDNKDSEAEKNNESNTDNNNEGAESTNNNESIESTNNNEGTESTNNTETTTRDENDDSKEESEIEKVENKTVSLQIDDSVWKMDDNIGYIKVDKVTEVNNDERTPSYQHQVFYVDECSYTGKYKFNDDLFFNSSHNNTNSSNFSNIYSFFNMYNNFNNCMNHSSYVNFDTFDQAASSNCSSSTKNIINYNYSYFNIFNYINNYMKSSIHSKKEEKKLSNLKASVAQKKSFNKLAKRTMRRNFLAVKTQIPSLIQRSEIIKVEASDFSPIMCAYQHIADFIIKLKKAVEIKQMREVQNLLVSELTENKTDNFTMIVNVFILNNFEWKKKRFLNNNHNNEEEEEEEEDNDDLIDDTFKEIELIIRKNRKEFNKTVPKRLMPILKMFLKILERGIKLHGKWVINNLEYVPLQYQFEHQFEEYSTKFNEALKL